MQLQLIALALCFFALAASFPPEPLDSEENKEVSTNESQGDVDSEKFAGYLVQLLMARTEDDYPLLLIQEDFVPPESPVNKRSRYYRRYPWKRQNGRVYEPDSYLCTPTRNDVFQLLLALHDTRSGMGDRTVKFCNRRRPARAVLTSVRFLGKR